jgi:amidase
MRAIILTTMALWCCFASAGIVEDAASIREGKTTSEKLVQNYLDRIKRIDRNGPRINSVLALNPDALAQARALDVELKAGRSRGPLHGVPVLIKDNIEVAGPLPTTAGSLALKNNVTNRDAPLVARLKSAGAVILGKTNLSEWANIRGDKSTSGWSAVGGLTKNPHRLDHNACGSSSGSGAAMAAELASAAVGTETDGSITCPASINGIVGFKPSVGLVSRTYIVPISASQDTAGPMTTTVRDAALILDVMAGSDPADAATVDADARKTNYTAALSADGLKGLRIGVLRLPGTAKRVYDAALQRLTGAGAVLVPLAFDFKFVDAAGEPEFKVLLTELNVGMADYLGDLPSANVPHKSLDDLIAFNVANAATELQYFGQETFISAAKTSGLSDAAYKAARETSVRMMGAEFLDLLIARHKLDLVVGQTNGPAWKTKLKGGDKFIPPSMSQAPAILGYPHLTVPMGTVHGLPVGLSFVGPKWSDALVLRAGHAFEIAGPLLRVRPISAARQY